MILTEEQGSNSMQECRQSLRQLLGGCSRLAGFVSQWTSFPCWILLLHDPTVLLSMACLQIQQTHLDPLWLTQFRNTEFRKPCPTDSEAKPTTWADRSPEENTHSDKTLPRIPSAWTSSLNWVIKTNLIPNYEILLLNKHRPWKLVCHHKNLQEVNWLRHIHVNIWLMP